MTTTSVLRLVRGPQEPDPVPQRAQAPVFVPRDRWLDVLRFLALNLFVVILVFDLPLFPWGVVAAGITLAVSGSLMARQLAEASPAFVEVLWTRLRRVLLLLWVFALALLPVMLWAAYTNGTLGMDVPVALWLWVVPVGPPPVTVPFTPVSPPLAYISAHVCLVLLSPPTLWLWRRWPRLVLAVPFVLLILRGQGILPDEGLVAQALTGVCVFAGCWFVGFARETGRLRQLSRVWLSGLVGLVAGATIAMALLVTGWGPIRSGEIPLLVACQITMLAAVLLKMPFALDWLARVTFIDWAIWASLRRAFTIVLLAPASYWVTDTVLPSLGVVGPDTDLPVHFTLAWLGTWILLAVACLLFGWIEDWATRNRAQLIPRRGDQAVPRRLNMVEEPVA